MNSFLNPEEILDQLILRIDSIAADFGCGSGGFVIPLAQKLKDGLVHAFDIQEPALSKLNGYCLANKINNVKISRCDLEKTKGSGLNAFSTDLVIIANALFQTDDKNAVMSEAERVLKNGGKLLVVDWNIKAPKPFIQEKILAGEVKKIAKDLNLKLIKNLEAGRYHYGLLFEKA